MHPSAVILDSIGPRFGACRLVRGDPPARLTRVSAMFTRMAGNPIVRTAASILTACKSRRLLSDLWWSESVPSCRPNPPRALRTPAPPPRARWHRAAPSGPRPVPSPDLARGGGGRGGWFSGPGRPGDVGLARPGPGAWNASEGVRAGRRGGTDRVGGRGGEEGVGWLEKSVGVPTDAMRRHACALASRWRGEGRSHPPIGCGSPPGDADRTSRARPGRTSRS